MSCRMPGKWGLQQTHYPSEQTGQTNPLACLRWTNTFDGMSCREPGKWGLQQTHYPPEQTGQTNALARFNVD